MTDLSSQIRAFSKRVREYEAFCDSYAKVLAGAANPAPRTPVDYQREADEAANELYETALNGRLRIKGRPQ